MRDTTKCINSIGYALFAVIFSDIYQPKWFGNDDEVKL